MGGGLQNAMRWKKINKKNTTLPWRGVYLRFEDLNVSPVVPRDSAWVFMPLTLSLTSVAQAAIPLLPRSSPFCIFCNAMSLFLRFNSKTSMPLTFQS